MTRYTKIVCMFFVLLLYVSINAHTQPSDPVHGGPLKSQILGKGPCATLANPLDNWLPTYNLTNKCVNWEAPPAGGGGSGVSVDLGNDTIEETNALAVISTSGDVNSIFTVVTDELNANLANNWPGCDVADELTCTGCVSDAELASTFLKSADINTFSELDAIVADETLVNTDDTQTLTGKTIDGNDNTIQALRHATDCTGITTGKSGQFCFEQDSDNWYVCEPSAGDCDTAGEWKLINANACITAATASEITCTGCVADSELASTFLKSVDIDTLSELATLSNFTISGNTTELGTTSGVLTSGDCVEFDVSGNLVAAGAACGTGGSTITLDLGDDGGNDSTALSEIAITGDTNSIFTESAADKLLVAVGNDWPKADVADEITCTGCVADAELASTFLKAADINPLADLNTVAGTTLQNFGTLTDGKICTYDLAGTQIDCDSDPAASSLVVEESDDDPTVSGVAVIQFNAAHFTVVDETGGQTQVNSILSPLATALADNPTDCSANEFANAIAASGNLSCAAISDNDVPDTITASNYLPLAGGTLTGQLVTDNLGIEYEESDTNPTCGAGNYNTFADLSETAIKVCNDGTSEVVTTPNNTQTLTNKTLSAASNVIDADTAVVLASDPADCSANQYANAIASSGALTCAAIAGAQVSNTPAGDIAAEDVQAAITELDTEKLSTSAASSTYFPIAGGVFSGDITLHDQSLTIADSGDGNPAVDTTTTITGNDLYVTCSDADGCNLTLSEGDPIHNREVRVWNISANAVNLVHSSGVAEMCGAANVVLAQKESANFQYVTDEWNQLCTQSSWADLYGVPAFRKTLIQLRPQANEPPAASFATLNTRNSHPALRFNGDVCAIWSFVMPNTYGGNGVTIDIFHVSTETTNDVDWDVSMELIGTSLDIDADSFATAVSGDGNANNATSGIPTLTSVALTSGAEMDSCVADALCRVRVCRDDTGDTGGADTVDYIGGQLRETP